MDAGLLTILVRDLGYRSEPVYGRRPLRHQFAWARATSGMSKTQIRRFVKKELNRHYKEVNWMLENIEPYRKTRKRLLEINLEMHHINSKQIS